jgi:hypothetical protein
MKAAVCLLFAVLLLAPGGLCRAVLLEIDSEPNNLDAWVDGRYLGRTPLTATLDRREVNLRLVEPSRSLYRAPVIDTLLSPDEADTVRVFFRIGPLVSVRSQPFGLPLLRNGRRIGNTPYSFRLGAEGNERLELLTVEGLVPIDAEKLRARGSWDWIGEESTVRISRQSEPTRLQKIGRHLMPAIALTMAAGGLIAEDQADRAYKQYLRAADPAEIQDRYDQTRRRDRLAAAFWIAAEVSAASAVIAWILPSDGRSSAKESKP